MLFWLPTSLENVSNDFNFYEAAERMRIDPVPIVLSIYRMTEIDRSSSVDSNDFISYFFATPTVQGYTP